MSARNRPRAKRQRKRERLHRKLKQLEAQGTPVLKHGVCTGCSRRRIVFLPKKLCERCCDAAS